MAGDLQGLVDDLASRLRRPLLLEDRLQRVVAYSEQNGPIDDIRRDSILRRHTATEVREWLRQAGIHESAGPLRTPAAPGLGLLPRVCLPARHGGRLLGFLWFIDAGPRMTDAEVEVAARATPAVALALFRESMASGLASRRELEAVTELLAGAAGAAARTLIEAGAFPQRGPVTALVVRPVSVREADDASRLALEQGLLAVRRRAGARKLLHLVRFDHGVLLAEGCAVRPDDVHEATAGAVVVGVGRPRPALHLAAGSYLEAAQAAEIALRISGLGRTVEWAGLGVYRLLTQFPPGTFGLHPGLEPLFADDAHLPLLETLETYLDLAGSAVATSRTLRLHRTSLYYRLQRVSELTGADLKDGGERLTLHLSLKLARLAGRYRPRGEAP
ncbi:hypothetical protein DP939_13285 [Spongiactinospora rosea]|uniref:PucR C-terminal helix-turn-helix domain-containing protein n=1 Tax=Spongiactinospora rosea TaxID=2248750 RepID=A0A366M0H3_9ACTN|nr:helix-turn-helix domain-containing protein [Spongiactinospora rosea]RBQ19696.1 hypothetical protein DP939_13285 [Spongiactinospora rosea]